MNQQDKWEELIRSDICAYNLAVPLMSIPFSNEFISGPKYKRLCSFVLNSTAFYYENFSDHYSVGNYLLGIFTKDKKKFKEYVSFWMKVFSKLKKTCERYKKIDFQKKSRKELANLLVSLVREANYWEGVAYNVDAIDATLNPLVEKIILEAFPGEKKSRLSEIYNKVTFPETMSYVGKVNLEKLELLKLIKQKKLSKGNAKITKFIKDYYWVNFSWGDSIELTENDLFSEAEKITLSRIDEELIKTRERVSDSLKEKALLVGKIKVSHPQLIDYLVVFEQYAVFHDLRKEGQVRAVSFIRKIFNEAAVRLRLSEKLLYYYWPFELAAVLEGKEKLDINLLTRRSSEWFCEYTCDKQYKEWFGEEAKRERAKLLDIPSQQVKELNGIGASSGRITGKARVVFGAKEAMEKIQPGEVLVTGMTMPDFVPAMKIASAVVTDEGGLTCHAAIICRELGKACVVGTKLGTKVIKDGDLVEVNANHGVVKIL